VHELAGCAERPPDPGEREIGCCAADDRQRVTRERGDDGGRNDGTGRLRRSSRGVSGAVSSAMAT